jgi:ubiquinone/menaquinone biosynthesis C-methylase UbiE
MRRPTPPGDTATGLARPGLGYRAYDPVFSEYLRRPAYDIEPADKMRGQAVAHTSHPAVTYAAGSAEHILLPDASCDAALLFFVSHHVVGRDGAARELRRVVKPGGSLFVTARATTSEKLQASLDRLAVISEDD